MANSGTSVTIQGSTYFVPTQSESAPWGDDLHDSVVALAVAVNSLSGSSDIPLTTFQIANNQASPVNVTGAAWNTGTVRSFQLTYSLYRSTSTNEEAETGVLYGVFSSMASTWDLSQTYGGNSTVTFSITAGGQLQYTSGNMSSGTGYSGTIKFKAASYLQV